MTSSLTARPSVLFIAGSINQTRQMHAIARELDAANAYFSPFYVTGVLTLAQRLGLLEMSIAGKKLARICLDYLEANDLAIDYGGRDRRYDLVVTCTDQFLPTNLDAPIVLVQEGMLDPAGFPYRLHRAVPWLVPRWAAGTAATGQSRAYERFCVASRGYRDLFVERGLDAEKISVTGIPNFDDCAKYHDNDFPHRGYVLVCTSDARETFKRDDREGFVRRAIEIADDRQLVFKLHPNEDHARATAEIGALAPEALVFASGRAEEMVANCDVLVCQYSSLAFVGLALEKEVHSYFDLGELERLLPEQNHAAAANIARVCRHVLDRRLHASTEPRWAIQEAP